MRSKSTLDIRIITGHSLETIGKPSEAISIDF